MQQCQILILGEAGMYGLSPNMKPAYVTMRVGVGTRALCCRFAANFFPEDYDPVIEGGRFHFIRPSSTNSRRRQDLYEKQVSVNGEDVNIQLYDVAGQEEYL